MAKILLVEDDNNLREIYEARLQAEGYAIVSAVDGEEALVIAKKEKPDLIISDVMMPRISGFEMLDILRNTDGLKDVKIIMLTALGQAEDKTRADSLGADRYLVKSQVTLEDIVRSAQELLGEATGAPTPPAPAPATSSPASPVATAVQPAAPAVSTPTPVAPPIPVTTPPAPSPVAAAPPAPAVTPAPAAQAPAPAAASTPQPAQQPAAPTPSASASNTQPTPPGPKPAEEPPAGVPTPTTPPQPPVTTPPVPSPTPLPQTSPSQVQVPAAKPAPSVVPAPPPAAASAPAPALAAVVSSMPVTPTAAAPPTPLMPAPSVGTPKPAVPVPTSDSRPLPAPEPPQQVPAAPSSTASHVNTPEAQTTSEEEAAVKSQIEEFINQNNNDQTVPVPKQAEATASTPPAAHTAELPKASVPSVVSPEPANDNKQSQAIMANAIKDLVSGTNPPVPLITSPAPTTIVPTQPVAPAPPAHAPAVSNDDSVTVAHKKIISPISQPTQHVPNLDELMAKEGSTLDDAEHVTAAAQSIVSPAATQAGSAPSIAATGPASYTQLPTTPHPPGHVISPNAAPGGVDPNSIAL